jgi:hypothetical protein
MYQLSPAQPSTGRTVLGILADCDVRAERDHHGEPNEAETDRDTRQQLWRKSSYGVLKQYGTSRVGSGSHHLNGHMCSRMGVGGAVMS